VPCQRTLHPLEPRNFPASPPWIVEGLNRPGIAYQVIGDGPIDIIMLPASISHVEASLMPRTYRCARLLETLD
jgi:hypothetical protein